MKNTLYLGLDVHKDSISIAIAAAVGRNGEVRLYGAISNDLHALEKALTKIRQAHGGAGLEVCYEGGPLRVRDRAAAGAVKGCLPGRRALDDPQALGRSG